MRRKSLGIAAAALVGWAVAVGAQGWEEPGRGTTTRAALMDAIRPIAEWRLGPVEFVVEDLRVAGDAAFASLRAQRPGGGAIPPGGMPGLARGELSAEFGDPTEVHVLYRLSGQTWVAVHHSFGATDAWWSWAPLCAEYRAVIGDAC